MNYFEKFCDSFCRSIARLATKKDLRSAEKRLADLITRGIRPTQARFDWAISLVTTKPEPEDRGPMEIKITNEQMVRVKLTPKTDTGKPAKLDGKPTWEIISGDSTIEVDDDGLGANLISADLPGDTEIIVKADADIGEGVEEISDIIKLSVVAATAKNLGIAASPPVAKPSPV